MLVHPTPETSKVEEAVFVTLQTSKPQTEQEGKLVCPCMNVLFLALELKENAVAYMCVLATLLLFVIMSVEST